MKLAIALFGLLSFSSLAMASGWDGSDSVWLESVETKLIKQERLYDGYLRCSIDYWDVGRKSITAGLLYSLDNSRYASVRQVESCSEIEAINDLSKTGKLGGAPVTVELHLIDEIYHTTTAEGVDTTEPAVSKCYFSFQFHGSELKFETGLYDRSPDDNGEPCLDKLMYFRPTK